VLWQSEDAAASSESGDICDGLPLVIHAPSDAGLGSERESDLRRPLEDQVGTQSGEISQRGDVSDGLAGVKVTSN